MRTQSQGSTAVAGESIAALIHENRARADKKYNRLTNTICLDCKAILDLDSAECANCKRRNLAGLNADGE